MDMTGQQPVPTNTEELRSAVLHPYDGLSKRLKQIARVVLDEPNVLALETLAVISERAEVQLSAIVRFAQAFGFEGATQMRRLSGTDCFLDIVRWGTRNAFVI